MAGDAKQMRMRVQAKLFEVEDSGTRQCRDNGIVGGKFFEAPHARRLGRYAAAGPRRRFFF